MLITTREQARQTVYGVPGLEFLCSRCGQTKPCPTEGCATGFGYSAAGDILCFACCGNLDTAAMIETGRATLYLTLDKERAAAGYPRREGWHYGQHELTNWPGTLRLRSGAVKRGRHNIAGSRWDIWFNGPDGTPWHGVQYGENTQICHCKRVKQ